jgi:nitrite reductase/ring-hydroxylating ferredoxin subunit
VAGHTLSNQEGFMENWIDIGGVDELSAAPIRRVTVMNREFAVSCKDGSFGVVSNTCIMPAGR